MLPNLLALLQNVKGFTGSKHFHVKPRTGSDGNNGLSPRRALKTLARAKALVTANSGDCVFLHYESNTAASTTDYQSVALDWNKDGVHLIGVGAGVIMGQRARIGQTSTVKTIEDLFTVSANNCYIANLEIFQGVATSTATAPRCMVVSGMRNVVENCQVSGIGDTSMDAAGARSLAVTGAENIFKHCYIGLDTVIRGTALGEIEVRATGNRNVFEDCIVNSYTSLSTFKAFLINTSGSSAHSLTVLKDCMLIAEQNRTSTVAPTGAIIFGYAGNVCMLGGGVFGYADVSTLDDANILVSAFGGVLDDDIAPVNTGVAVSVNVAD
jgi:hypothetical protein